MNRNPKPNSICKNINCQKPFVACIYCAKTQNWRSCCCSLECYSEYDNQVTEARSKKKNIDLFPNRTDMSKEQINEIINKPIEEVREISIQELTNMGYGDELQKYGFGGTVDKINEDLRNQEEAVAVSNSENTISESDKLSTNSESIPKPERTNRKKRKNTGFNSEDDATDDGD